MDSKTFCIYPFYGLNNNADGSVKLCCSMRENFHIKDEDGRDFNLGTDDINRIWTSEYMNTVRRKMLAGEEVDACRNCYKHEEQLGSSSRTEANTIWGDDLQVLHRVRRFQKDGLIQPLASLELRAGNTCNLQCNTCWGYSSSKVNEERIKLYRRSELTPAIAHDWQIEEHIPRDMNRWFKTEQYARNMDSMAPHLSRLYMTGGEPTLIRENIRLLQRLIDIGNTDCAISFTTNGTVVDSPLWELLPQFKTVEVQVSIDGIGDRANYVRYPTDWGTVDGTIRRISAMPNVRLVYYTVISAYNLYEISNILRYVESVSSTSCNWIPIFLDYPLYLHTTVWPLQTRLEALEQLKATLGSLPLLCNSVEDQRFVKLFNHYQNTQSNTQYLPDFIRFHQVLDEARGLDINKIFPELTALYK